MNCPKCQKENKKGVSFCEHCGFNINENTNKTNSKKKKPIILVILLIGIILIGIGATTAIIRIMDNKKVPLVKEETDLGELSSYNVLNKDFEKGNITADEYIQQMLYIEYDKNSIDKKYVTDTDNNECLPILEKVIKYKEQLSEETITYLFKKINLDEVTFEQTNQSTSYNNNELSATKISNDKKVTNLDKVLLSENGRFTVWYTTTGTNAITKEEAEQTAKGLEKSVDKLEDIFKVKYNYKAEIFSKGKKYKDQEQMLISNDIDTSYLETAMPVYMVNFTADDTHAIYMGGYGILLDLWYKIKGGDQYDSISTPYIMIKPDSFSDYERLAQLYNHELFHHFQYYVLCDNDGKRCEVGDNEFIVESTANWASSLITEKTTTKGYLNEWAATSLVFTDVMLTDLANKHSNLTISYALFPYINAYSKFVEDGNKKIMNAIYQNDDLGYLFENASSSEISNFTQYLAHKNLSQDYENKNYIASFQTKKGVKVEEVIFKSNKNPKYEVNNKEISPIGFSYYKLKKDTLNDYEISIKKDKPENFEYYIIGKNQNKYVQIKGGKNIESKIDILTSDMTDYNEIYFVIANKSVKEKSTVSLMITKSKTKVEIEDKPKENNNKENIVNLETSIQNFKMNAVMKLTMSIEGMNMTTESTSDGVVDQKNQKQYLSTKTSVMGFDITTEIYTDFKKQIAYTSVPFMNQWNKSKSGTGIIDIENLINKFKTMGSVTKISENKYKVKMTTEEIGNVVSSTNDTNVSGIAGDIYATVYLKGKYIDKIEYDFDNLTKEIPKFSMTLKLSDYNSAGDVVIPNAIINSATE